MTNGGPAFPKLSKSVTNHKTGVTTHEHEGDLTLRDYFATTASEGDVAANIAPHEMHTAETRAAARYKHADLMLAEREKKQA